MFRYQPPMISSGHRNIDFVVAELFPTSVAQCAVGVASSGKREQQQGEAAYSGPMPALPGVCAEVRAERAEDKVGGHVDGVDAAARAVCRARTMCEGEDAGLVANLSGLRGSIHEQHAEDEARDVIAEDPDDSPRQDKQRETDGDDPAGTVTVCEAAGDRRDRCADRAENTESCRRRLAPRR